MQKVHTFKLGKISSYLEKIKCRPGTERAVFHLSLQRQILQIKMRLIGIDQLGRVNRMNLGTVAPLIGVTIRSTVRKAAKLAVYDEMRISVKNHQTAPTIRPEMDLDGKFGQLISDLLHLPYIE